MSATSAPHGTHGTHGAERLPRVDAADQVSVRALAASEPRVEILAALLLCVLVGVGTVALLTALTGLFLAWLVLPLGAAAAVGPALWLRPWQRFWRRPVTPDAAGDAPRPGRVPAAVPWLVALAVIAIVSASNVVVHAEHVIIDRDPGVYATTGAWLARSGGLDVDVAAPVLSRPDVLDPNGAGTYEVGDHVALQFMHLTGALMGVGRFLWGAGGVFVVNGVIGLCGLVLVLAFCGRALRPWTAAVVASALALDVIQLHFTRDTYSEPIAQALIWGGLWAYLVARDRGDHRWAGLAGAALGLSLCTRVDGLLILIPLLGYLGWALVRDGGRGAAAGSPREPHLLRTTLLTGALFVPLMLADTLGPALPYVSDLWPIIRQAVALALVVGVGAVVCGWQRVRLAGLLGRLRSRAERLGWGAGGAAVLLGLFAWQVRPRVFADHAVPERIYQSSVLAVQRAEGLPLDGLRTYSEQGLARLALFAGPLVVVAAIAGLGVLAWRWVARRDDRLLLPVAVAGVEAALYLWQVSITPDMMWALRRFVPAALPLLLVLAGVGADALWGRAALRSRSAAALARRTGVAVLAVAAVAHPLGQALPLAGFAPLAGLAADLDDLCEEVDGAFVLLANEDRVASRLPQVLQARCGLEVAAPREGVEMAEALAVLDRELPAGRALVTVTSAVPQAPAEGVPVPLRLTRLEPRLLERPEATFTNEWRLAVTPVARSSG